MIVFFKSSKTSKTNTTTLFSTHKRLKTITKQTLKVTLDGLKIHKVSLFLFTYYSQNYADLIFLA